MPGRRSNMKHLVIAVVTLTQDVSDDVLKKAVEDQDYKVTGITA